MIFNDIYSKGLDFSAKCVLTFEKDNPPLALVVSPDVVAGRRAVIAGDVGVVEELPVHPVLGLVAPLVQRLRQLPERVRREGVRLLALQGGPLLNLAGFSSDP